HPAAVRLRARDRRPRRAAPARAGDFLPPLDARGRAPVVHGAVRQGLPDRIDPGAGGPTGGRARHARRPGALAIGRGRPRTRRRARPDPPRAASGGVAPLRPDSAPPLLRDGRRHSFISVAPRGALSLARRRWRPWAVPPGGRAVPR